MTKEINLDTVMKEEWGTYNKVCPYCFYRAGHNLTWCYECGKRMVKYDHKLTYKTYIDAATTKHANISRFRHYVFLSDRDEWRKLLKSDEEYISNLIDRGLTATEIHGESEIYSQTYSALSRLKVRGIMPEVKES